MADETSPAAVAEAPQVTAEKPVVDTSAPAQAETTAPESTKPDFRQLLSDPETKKLLFSDPDVAKELDHRAASEAGRRAKAEREAWERQQAERQAAEQQLAFKQRVAQLVDRYSDDPDAQQVKSVLDADVAKQYQARLQQDTAKQAGNWWLDMLAAQVVNHPDLSDEVKATLNPRDPKYATPDDFFKARDEAIASARVKKEVEKLLPVEREAIKQQLLAEIRGESQSPASLPQGVAATDDKSFLDAYGRGESNDHSRAKQLLGI